MIGLLSINHSVKTKDEKTPGRRGEWTESSGHFYGRLRAVQGIRGLSYTGGYGRFRGEWVKLKSIPTLWTPTYYGHLIITDRFVLYLGKENPYTSSIFNLLNIN